MCVFFIVALRSDEAKEQIDKNGWLLTSITLLALSFAWPMIMSVKLKITK